MPARSLVVTTELASAITRDLVRYSLLRPAQLAIFALSALAVTAAAALLTVAPSDSGDLQEGPLLLVVAALAFSLSAVITTVRRTRRAIEAAFPPGSSVTVELEAEVIRTESAHGSSTIRLSAYDGFGVTPSAVILRVGGARIFTVLPRSLLTADEIDLLRGRLVPRA